MVKSVRAAASTPARPLASPLDGLATPDGRYIVVRGRLWRVANPALAPSERAEWTRALMAARRRLRHQSRESVEVRQRARHRVQQAKLALGERGPVWWKDGAPDYGRHLVRNTPYADWHKRAVQWAAIIDRLLAARARDASICPSEVARAGEVDNWRAYLDEVRHVARHLARGKTLVIKQRGSQIDPDAAMRGPIRLQRPDKDARR